MRRTQDFLMEQNVLQAGFIKHHAPQVDFL